MFVITQKIFIMLWLSKRNLPIPQALYPLLPRKNPVRANETLEAIQKNFKTQGRIFPIVKICLGWFTKNSCEDLTFLLAIHLGAGFDSFLLPRPLHAAQDFEVGVRDFPLSSSCS